MQNRAEREILAKTQRLIASSKRLLREIASQRHENPAGEAAAQISDDEQRERSALAFRDEHDRQTRGR